MPSGFYIRKPVPESLKLERIKKYKLYRKDWYQRNKERRITAAKNWYLENRDYKLAYLKRPEVRKIAYAQRKAYRKDPVKAEKIRDRDSLWRHNYLKENKDIAVKEIKRTHEIYMDNQEQALQVANNHRQLWTAESLKYLYDNYQSKTILEMAKHLGRSWAAVSRRLNIENLHILEQRIKRLV
jgi:hypothetical protein